MNQTPPIIVTIKCCTYNHEPYIRQCLEGFVMQKTNFRFVAIVHDDASTDNTAAIVREYAEKYPDIIKPIYETENQYSKHDGSLRVIMNNAVESTGAKYVAMCEGDDYWIDPLKLQKQVDFLEKHSEYSMCFHNAKIKYETDIQYKFNRIEDREYTADELFKDWTVPTASILMISKAAIMENNRNIIHGDIRAILNCFKNGKVHGISDEMSVYRVQSEGMVLKHRNDLEYLSKYINHYKAISKEFTFVNKNIIKEKISNVCLVLGCKYIVRKKVLKGIKYLFESLYHHPIYFSIRICYIITHKMIRK